MSSIFIKQVIQKYINISTMKIWELVSNIISEKTIAAPKKSECSVGRSRLSNVRYAQCVGRGWLKHDSDHTDGTGKQGVKGSGKTQRGRYIKSEKFGGPNKYYPGSRN